MTSSDLLSDGNALTGPLHDLFRAEVTTAIGRCTASGRAVDQLLRARWAALQRAEARLAGRSYGCSNRGGTHRAGDTARATPGHASLAYGGRPRGRGPPYPGHDEAARASGPGASYRLAPPGPVASI